MARSKYDKIEANIAELNSWRGVMETEISGLRGRSECVMDEWSHRRMHNDIDRKRYERRIESAQIAAFIGVLFGLGFGFGAIIF